MDHHNMNGIKQKQHIVRFSWTDVQWRLSDETKPFFVCEVRGRYEMGDLIFLDIFFFSFFKDNQTIKCVVEWYRHGGKLIVFW